MKKEMKINNLQCPHCAARIEKEIAKIDGINDVSISFKNQLLSMDISDENLTKLRDDILAAAKTVEPNCTINF